MGNINLYFGPGLYFTVDCNSNLVKKKLYLDFLASLTVMHFRPKSNMSDENKTIHILTLIIQLRDRSGFRFNR